MSNVADAAALAVDLLPSDSDVAAPAAAACKVEGDALWRALGAHPDPEVRAALGAHPNTPTHVLGTLASQGVSRFGCPWTFVPFRLRPAP